MANNEENRDNDWEVIEEVGEDLTEDTATVNDVDQFVRDKVFVSTASQTGNELTWRLLLKEGRWFYVCIVSSS